jgi:hypothetical protein
MFLLVWLLFGVASAIVASNKGRSGFGWFLLGILLGPFGLIFALIVSKIERPADPYIPLPALTADQFLDQETKKCPHCAEVIKLEATKCRFCLETFDPDQVAREVAAHRTQVEAMLAAGRQFCSGCRRWDVVPYAMLPDGGHGPWCPNCKRPVQ